MPKEAFPDPMTFEYPDWTVIGPYLFRSDDIVSFGTELTPATVTEAYRKGIFPWYTDEIPLPWHCPQQRAVLFFDELTVPRSLEKLRRRGEFSFSIDRAFLRVIDECAESFRPGQGGTWITDEFKEVYGDLFDAGIVHSIEAWRGDELVGGLYGVDAGGAFCGESMFYKAPNASKLALLFLIDHLKERGSTWLDCQVMTPHMKALGAREIERMEFLSLLADTQRTTQPIFGRKES